MTLGRMAPVWLLAAIAAGSLLYWALGTPAGDRAPVPGFRASGERLIADAGITSADVHIIDIAHAAQGRRLQRRDGVWRMPSLGGYPADGDWAARVLDSVFDARILFDRRLRADEFARYGLQPVTAQGGSALRLTLRDADGRTLVTLRVGNLVSLHGQATERQGTLVALPDDRRVAILDRTLAQSWLANPRPAPLRLGVAPDRIDRMVIRRAQEDSQSAFRRGGDGLWYRTGAGGDGALVGRQHILDDLAEALVRVDVLDIETTTGSWNGTGARQADITVTTAGGLSASYRLVSRDDGIWVQITDIDASCAGDDTCGGDVHPAQPHVGMFLKTPADLREIVAESAKL